ncbi:patatin-like phospholipase family protein [soil metagenome]
MSTPKIGLALGGGSARGLAHIPFLEVFDELGIKPAVIAGCSIGALVGAAYASGMPARDMADYARQVLVNKRGAAKFLFREKGARIRTLLTLKNIASLQIDGEQLAGFVLPRGVASRVEDTVIPLKIVTTDFEDLREHVITRGSMARAVAASFAVPGIISAPVIDGHVHVDGGVTNPVPFDHVRDGMDIVVAIDVTSRPRAARRRHHSNFELGIGSMLIMFRQIAELRRAINPPDIYIEPPISAFKATEFFRAHEMLEAAGQAKDAFKRALEKRIDGIA